MERKRLWWVIVGLIGLNIIMFSLYLGSDKEFDPDEVVAKIGDHEMTRLEWHKELEERYGKDVLSEMVDQQVVAQMAKKYDIKVSDKAIDRELLLLKTMYGSATSENMNDKEWRDQIHNSLLLDELITKDVVVKEKDLKKYYEANKNSFQIPTTFHVSHIIVKTEEDAKQTIKELEDGSNFSTLAMERSLDEFSANQGGDIGFISEETDQYSGAYIRAVQELEEGKWSQPIETKEGYAIVLLHEKITGRNFAYKEVKDSIRRQIALEQMDMSATAKDFWKEAKVEWMYKGK